ncbi:hypothetical protein [Micromonospora sp. DR5-3]
MSARRDAGAARRFFRRALSVRVSPPPRRHGRSLLHDGCPHTTLL